VVAVCTGACSETGGELSGVGGNAGTALGGSGGLVAAVDGGGAGGAPLSQAYAAQLDTAAQSWAAAAPGCATYSYDRHSSSVFGSSSDTYVEVANGVPTRVHVISRLGNGPFGGSTDAGVTETDQRGADIPNPSALTVEGLLAECRSLLSTNSNVDVHLVTSSQGVPIICTITYRNCADDCTSGISLSPFVCAPLDGDGGITSP
jgi:hypothetical protein